MGVKLVAVVVVVGAVGGVDHVARDGSVSMGHCGL